MKVLLTLIFHSSLVISFGQCPKLTRLNFKAEECRNSRDAYVGNRIACATFFKLPEDSLAFSIDLTRTHKAMTMLENIPVSEYRLEYIDFYSQKIVKLIRLNDADENTLVICPDSLAKNLYTQNTLSKLREEDSIVIYFNSQHFFRTAKKILIQKTGTDLFATLTSLKGDYLPNPDFAKKEVKLTSKNIADFIRFENEIIRVTEDGCSLSSNYRIVSRYFNYYREGGECTWHGFVFLKASFFGRE